MATPESGSAHGVSPELILVSEEEEAERARAGLAPIVPTDERLFEESAARIRAASIAPPPPPPSPPPLRTTLVAPRRELPPAAPPPAAPARRGPSRRGPSRFASRLAGALALISIAAVGVAVGSGWNPVGGRSDQGTVAATPPAPGRVGTATSRIRPTSTAAAPHPSTQARTRSTPASPTTARHETTPATSSPRTTSRTEPTSSAPTTSARTTSAQATTTAKPRIPGGPITPARTFAWPAASGATFYLVRFFRNATVVFQDRVTEPRLTLPARFVLKPGRYRWTVLPARGTVAHPNYGPAIVDSQLVVAG